MAPEATFATEIDLTALHAARDTFLAEARRVVDRATPLGSGGEGSLQASAFELAVRALLDSGTAAQQGDDGLAYLLGAAGASLRGKPASLSAGFTNGLRDIRSRQGGGQVVSGRC